MFKKLIYSALGVVLLGSVGAVAQMWGGLPTLGGPSYCFSLVNNSCVQTVPAGPSVTGNETIPADTNLTPPGGVQTIRAPITVLGGGKLVVSAPLTGATITLDAQTRQLIVNPAGTIAALTVAFPAASSSTPYDGQRIGICGTQIVTALTATAGTGNTFGSTVTSQAMLVPIVTGGASCMEWVYNKTSATVGVWYRTQ